MRLLPLTLMLSAAACGESATSSPPPQAPTVTSSVSATTPTGVALPAAPDAMDTPTTAATAPPAKAPTLGPRMANGAATPADPGTATGSIRSTVTTETASLPAAGVTLDEAKNPRNQPALTAGDQGSSPAEIRITAAIRKAVIADSSLSFGAKNVKIITQGTKVTLRGSVPNAQQRASIEARARQAAGVTDVDDQIEVK